MTRAIIWFKDSEKYVNIAADHFYEYEGMLKIFNGNNPAAIFDLSIIKGVYLAEERK